MSTEKHLTIPGALEWDSGSVELDIEAWPFPPNPAAQHQGDPVALQHMAVAEDGKLRWMTGRKMQGCELYAMPDGSAIRSKLYAEQPAPVALVMPERKTKADYSGYIEQFQSEAAGLYNSALDDVARLSGVKQ